MRMLQTEPDRNTVRLEHGVGMAHNLLHLGLTHSAMHRAEATLELRRMTSSRRFSRCSEDRGKCKILQYQAVVSGIRP
jgi:hypothetical protein